MIITSLSEFLICLDRANICGINELLNLWWSSLHFLDLPSALSGQINYKRYKSTSLTSSYPLLFLISPARAAEVARAHGRRPPKSLVSDENFKPEHALFCRELRFVAIYALFGDLWSKKVPIWVKNSVSWTRSALLHGIYFIFYWVDIANFQT